MARSLCPDSQSVKADAVVESDSRGFDGGKLINGHKRHVVVDTLGLLLAVMATATDVDDRVAAQALLDQVAAAHHLLALVWADGGYTGSPSSSTASPPSPWSSRSSSTATTCAVSSCCPRAGSSSGSSPT
ncbi:transposase [Streptomyces sp. NPDC053086]|uniref:transposase n=1 Tax=unclassified Streptomyces TaxID=2593676 RepID=UPI0037D01EF6